MKSLFFKRCVILVFLLVLVQLASADLFIVSVDKWVNCEEYTNNVTVCQKNNVYDLMEENIIPNINTNYYDSILDEVVNSKNKKIDTLENRITGYATYNSEIENWYSAMEKIYLIGLVVLSLLLVNAYYQVYKSKKK